ncbi:MAG: 5-formyltetrahydrofolate cyclo-ligase [Magnetococcales bacterium]|nr:5-formyltetrahydrofolate cyclo-ligase [Magnetococcales bacterium]
MDQLAPQSVRQSLRRSLLQQRQQQPSGQVAVLSRAICHHVLTHSCYQNARAIALYWPIHHEVDPTLLIQPAHDSGKTILLPVIVSTTSYQLCLAPFRPGDPLLPGPFGILQPACLTDTVSCHQLDQIDVLFMPVVGFDTQGGRLGYGGGYYDRCLAATAASCRSPCRVGLAYQWQQLEILPLQPHDVRLQSVVTEQGWRNFS